MQLGLPPESEPVNAPFERLIDTESTIGQLRVAAQWLVLPQSRS
jgi:hypothetical protein